MGSTDLTPHSVEGVFAFSSLSEGQDEFKREDIRFFFDKQQLHDIIISRCGSVVKKRSPALCLNEWQSRVNRYLPQHLVSLSSSNPKLGLLEKAPNSELGVELANASKKNVF
jgi:hypothetical protein